MEFGNRIIVIAFLLLIASTSAVKAYDLKDNGKELVRNCNTYLYILSEFRQQGARITSEQASMGMSCGDYFEGMMDTLNLNHAINAKICLNKNDTKHSLITGYLNFMQSEEGVKLAEERKWLSVSAYLVQDQKCVK